MTASDEPRVQRTGAAWVLGLIAAFAVVFAANGILIWKAFSVAPQIDPSYESEAR